MPGPYSGTTFPYYITLTCPSGSSNVIAVSEKITVPAGGITGTVFEATVTSPVTWASGATIGLYFYNSSDGLISSVTQSSGSLTANVATTIDTAATNSPANTTYMVAAIQYNGSPSAANALSVSEALVTDSVGTRYNSNFAFVYDFSPWSSGANVGGYGTSPSVTWGTQTAILQWNYVPTAAGSYDSLVMAGEIELMGGPGGVPSQIPELMDAFGNGAVIRIVAPPSNNAMTYGYQTSYDFSAPQPTVDIVESMLLDGERPFGSRASNRTITLPLIIRGTTMQVVQNAREYIMSLIDQQTWRLTFMPASTGLAHIFDCFRANPTSVSWGFMNDGQMHDPGAQASYLGYMTVQFQALPYVRSDTDGTYNLKFSAPLIGANTAATAVTMDAFTSLGTNPHWSIRTKQGVTGQSVFFSPPMPIRSPYPAAVFTKSGLSLNIRQLTTVSVWFGQAYDKSWATDRKFISDITLSYVLTDNNGHTLSFHTTRRNCPWSTDENNPKWTRINAQIPPGVAGFNYANVVSYKVTVTNWSSRGSLGLARVVCYLNNLVANPNTITAPSTRCNNINLVGFAGSARTPITTQVQLPASAAVSQELYGSGVWWPPPGVTSVQVECIGGGGAGGSVTAAGIGGGGGGGEYAQEPAVSVTPGTSVPYNCGAGGMAPQPQQVVTFSTPGTGNWTCPANVTSVKVECWGGGAAGASGGAGGNGGCYTFSNSVTVTPGKVYPFIVGTAGVANSGTTTQLISSRGGALSKFTGDSVTIQANGANTARTGSSTPGAVLASAGSGGTSYAGGVAGSSPGSGGGGGGASAASAGPGAAGGTASGNNGGAGGIAASGGGNGGKGANTPGFATAGSSPGGGGGGGCTTSSGNQIGANGAPGQVQLTYTVNGGSAVNGGTTTFGSATSSSVTTIANGGTSVASNTPGGASGGTGSSNTIHNNGGTGAWTTNTSGPWSFLQVIQQSNFTAASQVLTSGVTVTLGTVFVVILATTAALFGVTDSVGNVYSPVSSTSIGNSAFAYIYAAPVGAVITNGTTTLTITASVNQAYAVQWWTSPFTYGVDNGCINTGGGTSSGPTITFGTGGNGNNDVQIALLANNAASALTASPGFPIWAGPSSNTMSFNNLRSALFVAQAAGPNNANTATGTYASSVAWGSIALPLYISYAQAPAVVQTNGNATGGFTASSLVTHPTQTCPVGGTMVVLVGQASSSGVVTVTDSGSNTYTNQKNVTVTAKFQVFTAPITTALTTSSNITISDTVSQNHIYGIYYVPNCTGFDNGATATGTSTSASVTDATMTNQNDIEFYWVVDNVNTLNSAGPAGWTAIDNPINGSSMTSSLYCRQAVGTAGSTVASSFSSPIAWGAIAFSLTMNLGGGGGGASGGSGGPGYSGFAVFGGPAMAGGGKGAGVGTNAIAPGGGQPGTPPGGGGSGAYSSSGVQTGGNGGNGYVVVTWQPPLQTFNTLIVHRPGANAPNALNPCVPLGNTADAPVNIEYPVPSLVSGVNALFNGTYSVVLMNYLWDTPGNTRQVTVTVAQYEYQGGPAYKQSLTRTITPSTDITNGLVIMGELTLPTKAVDPSTTSAYFTVSITDTDTNDRFMDVLFLDTQGETTIVNIPSGNAGYGTYSNYYLDEPTIDRDLGLLLASGMDRAQAVSVLDSAIVSGGPLFVDSGDNLITVYSPVGAPNVGVTYNPRWYVNRMV